MELTTIQITVPKDMAPFIETADRASGMERNAMILYPYIKDFTISHGRAAEILGVNKIDLIEFYSRMGLPYLDLTPEEVEEELAGEKARQYVSDSGYKSALRTWLGS